MGKPRRPPPRPLADIEAALRSDDEDAVVRALHAACPCAGSSEPYQQLMPVLHQLAKDPRPRVRAVALHLQEDAMGALQKEDERANGFQRNRPGGFGPKGTPRRPDVRHGFR